MSLEIFDLGAAQSQCYFYCTGKRSENPKRDHDKWQSAVPLDVWGSDIKKRYVRKAGFNIN